MTSATPAAPALTIRTLTPDLMVIEADGRPGLASVQVVAGGVSGTAWLTPHGASGRLRAFYGFARPLCTGDVVKVIAGGAEAAEAVWTGPDLDGGTRLDLTRRVLLRAPDWSIDTIEVEGDRLRATGWHIRPVESPLRVRVNGVALQERFMRRPDVEEAFSAFLDRYAVTAFAIEGEVPPAAEYHFELEGPLAQQGTVGVYSYPAPQPGDFPLPSPSRIHRVNGFENTSAFLRLGHTNYRIISGVIQRRLGDAPIRVLDWGCGCGGVARHFLKDARFDYAGCDIDGDNLQWCRENLDDARFHQVSTTAPQTMLLPTQVDAIFGVSVISHLSRSNIVAWSHWLARNLRPGGVLVLTTLGLQALAKSQSPSDISDTLKGGVTFFSDLGHDIGGVINDQTYYGTSYQSPAELNALFSHSFELVEHHEGMLGHQDGFVFIKT